MSQHDQPQPQQQPQPAQPEKKGWSKHPIRNAIFVGVAAFIVAMVAVAVAAPSEPTKQSAGTPPAVTETTTAAPTAPSSKPAEPAPSQSTTEPVVDDGVAAIGKEWFNYEDGISVQVTKVSTFRISETASGGQPGDKGVVVTVTLRNKGVEAFDTALVQVDLASGPNGDQSDNVFDSANGIGAGFEGSIPPGKSRTAKFGFAVPRSHTAVEIEVTPSWDHNGSHFAGTIGR